MRTVYQWCSLQDGLCTEQPAEDGGGGEGGKEGGVEDRRMGEEEKVVREVGWKTGGWGRRRRW